MGIRRTPIGFATGCFLESGSHGVLPKVVGMPLAVFQQVGFHRSVGNRAHSLCP